MSISKGKPFTSGPIWDAMKFSAVQQPQEQVTGQLANVGRAAQLAEELKSIGMTPDTAGLIAYTQMRGEKESSPERLKEQLGVLGPYLKDVARENQRLAMEANLFAGILDMPNKFSRAMAAQHYYMPETMQAISQNIGRETPFLNRQYVQL
jgi:hypothetical protein